MQPRDITGSFIKSYPREAMRMVPIIFFLMWLSVSAIIGIVIFMLRPWLKVRPVIMVSVGILLAGICIGLECWQQGFFSFANELHHGWNINADFWWRVSQGRYLAALLALLNHGFNLVFGCSFMLATILSAVDLLPVNPHQRAMTSLHQGKKINQITEIGEEELEEKMSQLNDSDHGTVLGISRWSGQPVILKDHEVNHVVFVLGTTGAGKTVTLRRFYRRAIMEGYPLIIVDGKPGNENVEWLSALAGKHGRKFHGFNCANHDHYDPLANGGYTELKDKIINLKDQWENDYYRSIAEDYLQTTLQVLLKSGKPFDLATIVQCLDYDSLIEVTRNLKDKILMERVKALENYERSDITGLQAHLNLLIHSELGDYFNVDEKTFQLSRVIDQNAIVYFALPALRFPSFSRVLGKLVINDLKAVIDRSDNSRRVFMVFDEFSIFAGDQVLNLVNMGRGKGVHAIFGTQGLADLDRVDASFKRQLLNCENTLICHRVNDHESAEMVAAWTGTKDKFNITSQLDVNAMNPALGTVSQVREFIIHPDAIKQELRTGDVYLISKVGGFRQDKIRVKYC